MTALPKKLSELNAFLGSNEWFAGGKGPSFVDFYAYEILDHHRRFEPKLMEVNSNLVKFFARFEALPKIKAYHGSDRCIVNPINGPTAKWGNK